MNKCYILLLFFLVATFSSQAQWSREKGKGYYKLSAWSLVSDQHYNDTGSIDPNVTRGLFNLSIYAEYGISDKFDVVLYFPFFTRAYRNDQISGTTSEVIQKGEAENNIGDTDIAVKYSWFKKDDWALSSSLKFGIPTGNSQGGSDGSLQTGDGEFNQQIQSDLGYSFSFLDNPAYLKTYLAYNNRTENFSDELHYGAEAGLSFFESKFWVNAKINILQSLKNGSLSAQTAQGSIFANNIEYTSIGGELAYYITQQIGVSLSVASAINGRIIYANETYSAGVFLDIK